VVGWTALGQTPGALDLIGMAFVLGGVAIQERDELSQAEAVIDLEPS